MALHRLTSVTMGVPNVSETADYYAEFGLTAAGDGWFSTADGGRQLRITHASTRRLAELSIGTDDEDDLDRAAARLEKLGVPVSRREGELLATERVSGVTTRMSVAPRIVQQAAPRQAFNGPGRVERANQRASGFRRTNRVRPRKLGHAVIGSTDYQATIRFFLDGIGFRLSDLIRGEGAFMRCSTDHHNLLVLRSPVTFLHHTSWQVDDIDDVGRGAIAMLEGHPGRHVWGLGRHYAGSNFFWYLKDPAGGFSEYYSDMDCIIDDQLWTPEDLEGARGLFAWGPPPPPSFVRPDDLAEMMTGAHSAR
jgi:catechol 2,3-dioxygenase-like lactoylglutathione lyase family enzyme